MSEFVHRTEQKSELIKRLKRRQNKVTKRWKILKTLIVTLGRR